MQTAKTLFLSVTTAWAVATWASVSTNSVTAFSEQSETKKVALFLTGGQSNIDGRLDGVSAGQQLPSYLVGGNSNALVCATSGNSTRVGTFLAYAPTSGEEGQPSKWAYDAVTYSYIGQAMGTFYVAKTSYGGTSINPAVNNSPSGTHAWIDGYGSGYHWSADPTFLAATDIAGNASSSYNTTAAVNVGRSGAFEAIVRANGDNAKYQLLFNGKVVDEMTNAVKGTTFSLKGTNTTSGVYYISFDSYSYLFGARFVPEEEMPPVTVTIPTGGVTAFGNIFGVTFTVPDGAQAYTADVDASNATRVVFTEVASINVGQTVILRGASGVYTLQPVRGVAYTGDNLLVAQVKSGLVEAVAGKDFANYLVQGSGTSVTFTKSDETTVVPAGSGYLSVSTGTPQSRQTTLSGTLPPPGGV